MLVFRSALLWIAQVFVLAAGVMAADRSAGAAAGIQPLQIESSETIRFHDLPVATAPCHTRHAVYACSDFVLQRFHCRCRRDGSQWKLSIHAELRVVIHLVHVRFLLHERQHLEDIRSSLPEALQPFLEMRFDREQTCAHLADVISTPAFTMDMMNTLREVSNQKHHCSRIAQPLPGVRSQEARRKVWEASTSRDD
ncbi:MAG: hypothetical protein WBX15_15460 [Thermoanaerobaculia bacterium]